MLETIDDTLSSLLYTATPNSKDLQADHTLQLVINMHLHETGTLYRQFKLLQLRQITKVADDQQLVIDV